MCFGTHQVWLRPRQQTRESRATYDLRFAVMTACKNKPVQELPKASSLCQQMFGAMPTEINRFRLTAEKF